MGDSMQGASESRIYLSPPDVGDLEQQYVLEAMRSGWVAPAGPDLEAFEREVAERVGVSHAVGLASSTEALHLARASLGVGPGDGVPASALTFAAILNAMRYVGAEPYFVDCDAEAATCRLGPSRCAPSLPRRSRGQEGPRRSARSSR